MDLENNLNRVRVLSRPLNVVTINTADLERLFLSEDAIEKISIICENIDSSDKAQRAWFFRRMIYALGCLDIIYDLHTQLAKEKQNVDLGVKDQKCIFTLIDIVISWVIFPQLDKALVKRLTKTSNDGHRDEYSPDILIATVKVMITILNSHTIISNRLKTIHISVILGSLIQLLECSRPNVNSWTLPPIIEISTLVFSSTNPLRTLFSTKFEPTQISQQICPIMDSIYKSTNLEYLFSALLTFADTDITWLSSYCKKNLSLLLTNENGLTTLMRVLLSDKEKDEVDPRQIQAISKLVSNVPSFMDAGTYYKKIGDQISRIILGTSNTRLEYAVAVSVIVSICSKSPNVGYYNVVCPLLDRFTLADAGIDTVVIKYAKQDLDIHKKKIIVCPEDVVKTMELLEKILDNTSLSQNFAACLLRIVPQIYCLYEAEHEWKDVDKGNKCMNVIVRIFRKCDTFSVCATLKFILLDMHKTLYTEISRDENGLPLIVLNNEVTKKTTNTELFAKLISHEFLTDIIGEIFLYMLEVMNSTSESLYDDKILMIDVILHIINDENSCNNLLKNPTQIITFAMNLLSYTDEKFLTFAIGLIYAIIASNEKKLSHSLKYKLQKINDILRNISNNENTSTSISNAADELIMYINSLDIMKPQSGMNSPNNSLDTDSEFVNTCIEELSHEILPVRAHAMSKLRALIEKKSDSVSSRLESIFTTVLLQLSHDDSFLYLNAIRLICSLVVNYPHIFLNRILSIYNDRFEPVDNRVRVGEIILQSMRLFGQIFPMFSDIYIHKLLNNLSDKEQKIKSSTLSLISLIAEQQPLSLSRYIYTLLDSIKNMLIFEKDVDVRRGAVAVLSNLSYYVEKNNPSRENLTILKQLYTILKTLSLEDEDKVVRATSKAFTDFLKSSLF